MRNIYPGVCYRCGATVDPGDGHYEKVSYIQRNKWSNVDLPKWLLQHATCAINFRGTDRHYQAAPHIKPMENAS